MSYKIHLLFILALYLSILIFFRFITPQIDEPIHLNQIQILADQKDIGNFFDGTVKVHPRIPMIPGYHYVMATFGWLMKDASLWMVRAFTAIFGFLSVCVFALVLKKVHGEAQPIRIWQYALFPIFLQFHFLVYTESLSWLLVLLGFYLEWQKRHALSAFLCILSILVRQNNIIWVVMFPIMTWIHEGDFNINLSWIVRQFRRYWLSFVTCIGFLVFVYFNGGVALGDRQFHPSGSFHSVNVFLMCFDYFVLFLPGIITRVPRWPNLFSTKPVITGIVVTLVAGIYIYSWMTFLPEHIHPWNREAYNVILHDGMLHWFVSSDFSRLVYLTIILIAVIDVLANPLQERAFELIYPFSVLFVMPSWLAGARYYVIPLTFILLFRKKVKPSSIEMLTIVYYALGTAMLILLMYFNKRFL